VTPIKNEGQVVGARISMVLINDYSTNDAYVSLVSPQLRQALTRPEAVQPGLGKLAHQFPPEKGIVVGQPREVTFEILYGQGNTLKSGDHFDLLSAWPGSGGNNIQNPHVFGAVLGHTRPAGHLGDIQLP
jgi:hypothetical protein